MVIFLFLGKMRKKILASQHLIGQWHMDKSYVSVSYLPALYSIDNGQNKRNSEIWKSFARKKISPTRGLPGV
jgi:hypothetical protein